MSREILAGRPEQQPKRYAKVTSKGLSETLRGRKLGIESKSGAEKGGGDARPKGMYLANLRRALEARNSKDGDARRTGSGLTGAVVVHVP